MTRRKFFILAPILIAISILVENLLLGGNLPQSPIENVAIGIGISLGVVYTLFALWPIRGTRRYVEKLVRQRLIKDHVAYTAIAPAFQLVGSNGKPIGTWTVIVIVPGWTWYYRVYSDDSIKFLGRQ